MYDLTTFPMSQMIECGAALRRLGQGASSMEETANRIADHLYERFVDPGSGTPSLALVRLFKTTALEDLDPDGQAFALRLLGDRPTRPGLPCLTLFATRGDQPEWNARQDSVRHRAIPLPSERVVERFPMLELRDATRAAEAASRAKNAFLATISHEIRTPMTGLMGTAELLCETNLSPEQRELIEIVRSSASTLLTIINDILDYSKIEAGEMTLQMQSFDLSSLVEEVVWLFRGRAVKKRLSLARLVARPAGAGERRSGASPTDPVEPGEQRNQVH